MIIYTQEIFTCIISRSLRALVIDELEYSFYSGQMNDSKILSYYNKEMNKPMARKMSLTFIAVFAEVSMKSKPLSSAYVFASSSSTVRLFARSDLFPASAITILGDACLCSSFTHVLARPNVSCNRVSDQENSFQGFP